MKKIQLFQDQLSVNKVIRHYENLLPHVLKIKEEFEKLNVGPFTKEIFCIMEVSGINSIELMVQDIVIKNLDDLKVHYSVRKSFYDTIKLELISLSKAIAEFNKFKNGYSVNLNASDFEFDSTGTPILSDSKRKEFEDQYSIFVENEKEFQIYNKVLKILEAIDDLNLGLPKNIIYDPYNIKDLVEYDTKRDKCFPGPGLKYAARFYEERSKESKSSN